MPATLTEVQEAILRAFPDADVTRIRQEGSRVLGVIVSSEFTDKEDRERNRLVSERVRELLGLRGLNVGILFPLAPGESL
ncbi:MAG: hypothetical protein NT029_12660 [Armatimonadetes bacterium]|nr:hypothetical protein [Armatimonadota bacterium]